MRRFLIVVAAAAAASACANSTKTAPDTVGVAGTIRGVNFQPDVAVMESFPVQLAGSVRVTNRLSQRVTLSFPGSCEALLRVYDLEGGRNTPVWDQRSIAGCELETSRLDLAAGETIELRIPTVSAYEILGDSLPDGTYRVTIYLEPNGRVVEVEAGEVELAVPRQPVSGARFTEPRRRP